MLWGGARMAGGLTETDRTVEALQTQTRPRPTPAGDGATPASVWAPPGGDANGRPGPTATTRRLFRHPRLMHYNRLIVGVFAINLAILAYGAAIGGWWQGETSALRTISAVAQANLVLAVLPRQHWLVNLVGWLATRPSTRWPLRVRWTLGKYYHVGGLHVGAAVSGAGWYLLFVLSLNRDFVRGAGNVTVPNLVVSLLVVELFIVMIVLALPRYRRTAHDHFEITHRFCAWAALVLVWINTVLFVASNRGELSLIAGLLHSPTAWMLALTTMLSLWPWLLLRRVPIEVERPSSHAAIVRLFQVSKPPIGTTRPISRHPLVGWHHFANVPVTDGGHGYRMVISRAGDWTADFIDDPPPHVWVRGLPTVGVANVKRLFTRVVYVVTGSGIGPALGHLLGDERPSRLVWITRDPERTYGAGLVGEIRRAQPDAVVWNSDRWGKPNVLQLAHAACVDFDAEAVICISNKTVTWQVVHGLEQQGIPAFGPIWDS
jgi:hypothetical protein